jgi:hypothetical protein
MAIVISTWALLLASGAPGEAQSTGNDSVARAARRAAGQALSRDHRNSDRMNERQDSRDRGSCAQELREYARKNDEFEQWLRKQHIDWHRGHDGELDNFVRQHQALHGRLDRARLNWQSQNRPPRCARGRGKE